MKHPDFYGTSSHHRNVEKGHYKDLDHVLLAQIYSLTGTSDIFHCDKSIKPMKIFLSGSKIAPVHMTSGKRRFEYHGNIKQILSNAENYHDAYYKAEIFRGHSLYFHERALATRNNPASLTHLEYVYATLASWGMHRMGRGGSKMRSFDFFSKSVQTLKGKISEAQTFELRELSEIKWAVLEEIFYGVKVMASGTSLVGNSKVMHHMLPNVIPPIDRSNILYRFYIKIQT